MDEHPWESALIDFRKNVMPQLTVDGPKIGDAARSGDNKARKAIRFYTMLQRSFDPMTLQLLKDALDEYRASI